MSPHLSLAILAALFTIAGWIDYPAATMTADIAAHRTAAVLTTRAEPNHAQND